MRKILSFTTIFFTLFLLGSCNFIASFTDADYDIELSFDKTKTSVLIGEMDVINLTASEKQNSAKIVWEYDEEAIFAKTDNYSAVITGLKSGNTTITARCGSNSVSCVVAVSSENYAVTITNPYVYASHDYVDIKPNSTFKISASLFGGSVADIDGFSFSIDKPSVATLTTEGNYCWITGLNDGMAKVSVKHNKAAYGFSVLVNCASDGTTNSYITTSDNIITINKSENDTAEFSVTLQNPTATDFASGFTFDIVDELGNTYSSAPVTIASVSNGNVTVKAISTGNCYIRAKHPNAEYSLDILVRVIENAEVGYIEPSETICVVSGSSTKKIDLSLNGYSGTEDISLYTWNFQDDADEYIEYEICNGNDRLSGNSCYIKGKKTGSVKATVSYPGLSSRCIIILVRDIQNEASDVTTYITTSQNYIRMSKSSSEQKIDIMLKNCSQNDISNLKWNIKNIAQDGSNSNVIEWATGNGSASYSTGSRSILISDYSENAYAIIKPLNVGTAYIEISHPKAVYKTLITVVVTEEKETAKPYLTSSGSPLVYIKNGNTFDASVNLNNGGEDSSVIWTVKEGVVTIAANGLNCVITAPTANSGITKSTVTASYGESFMNFTICTFDTEDEYNSCIIPFIYTMAPVNTITEGLSCFLSINTENITDYTNITWSVISGNSFVSIETSNNNRTCNVLGLKSGQAQIKASYSFCDDVIFTVTVISSGIIDVQKDCYLTTSNNVVYFSSINESKTISIEAINISDSAYGNITWECSSPLFEISANGVSATITSLSDNCEAVLKITHPLSENELLINLRSGSQFVYINEDIPYIITDKDVLELYEGQEEVSLYATLNHTEEAEPSSVIKGFVFTSSDESIATVSYVAYSNTCYVKPIKNGTCTILVSHPDSKFEKEVVVVVKHSGDATSLPYITTESNVITIIQGDFTTASVSLVNSDSINNSCWSWSSFDSKIASVVANNGTSAMICANGPGTTQLKITHTEAPYALNIIVVVLDASVVSSRPYISVSDNIVTIQKGSSTSVTAEMLGNSYSSDSNYFRFFSANSSVALVTSASGSAYIRGVTTGMTYVTVSNSRYSDSYSRTILVIVEDEIQTGVYISPSVSILKIKPDDTSLQTITATLVNGEETDGQDFIWWADDYNLISLSSVAENCSVVPTGKTGNTKIHIKHAKSQKQCDILVLVSKYDSFAFPETSVTISTEKLYFYPMQVPAMEEGYSIEYKSSNTDVCIVEGSNSVAWLCGISYGTINITAKIISDVDNSVISSAEMLVYVSEATVSLPVISLGNSILTVEKGTSKILTAIISGEGIADTERYNLKWTVKNQDNGISFLNENEQKSVYGSDCYVTFEQEGQYVISVTHEKSGAESDIFIVVKDAGLITIELSSNLESVYKDDGSFTLTAILNNATAADYKNIEWSAVKIGGNNIVSVSKSKGEKCTVTPKMVGQTTVIAKLPNGEIATCVVIVKASAELKFEMGTVHVIPGYTEVISYTTNPSNVTINWYTQMATTSYSMSDGIENYFSIEDDPVKKQLHITGLKEHNGSAAGTITAAMVGASSANLPMLNVFVEYKLELNIFDENHNMLTLLSNNNPDTNNTRTFEIDYYPTDLDIDILFEDTRVQCITDASANNLAAKNHTVSACPDNLFEIGNISREIFIEEGIQKARLFVTVIPHSEGAGDIKIVATLPSDTQGTYSAYKSFYYSAFYDEYTFDMNMELTPTGAYTNYDGTSLHLTDGEAAMFYLKIHQENAKGHITNVIWEGDSTVPELNGNCPSKITRQADRQVLAKEIWCSTDLTSIKNGSGKTPSASLISLEKNTTDSGQTFYTLKHNWDYYNDLPTEMATEEAFVKWFGEVDEEGKFTSNSNNQFDPNVFTSLKNKGVEWLTVYYEPVLKTTGAYFIPHQGVTAYNLSVETGYKKDDWWSWKYWCRYYEQAGYIDLYSNNSQIYYLKNTGNTNNKTILYSNVKFKKCIPYVISLDEVKKNQFFKTAVKNIRYYKTRSFLGATPKESDAKDTITLSQANFYTNAGKLMLLPTVSKVSTKTDIGTGNLFIDYENGYGNNVEKAKSIPVVVEKRMCEAYTNGNWKKEKGGYNRYVISDKLFDDNSIVEPEFTVDANCVEKNATDSNIVLTYDIYPKNVPVYIEIPKSTYTLGVVNGTIVNETSSSITYSVQPVQSKETQSMELIVNGAYKNSIKVYATVDGNKPTTFNVPIIITPNVNIGLESSGTGWTYNKDNRILTIKDGANIETSVKDLNGQKGITFTNIEYHSYDELESLDDDKYITRINTTTESREQELFISFKKTGTSSFLLKHSTDYGYFAYTGGVQDCLYKKDFSVYIDEYNDSVDKIKQTLTELNEDKLAWLKKTSSTLTSYTFNFYYENGEIVYKTKTVAATPVGTLYVTYTDDIEKYTNEIIVCVEISNAPYTVSDTYGFAVPESYYLNPKNFSE